MHQGPTRGLAVPLVTLGAGFVALGAVATNALATNCIQHDLRIYTDEIVPVPQSEMVPTHQPGSRMGPPADPNVGDSWIWYTWLLGGFPMAEEKMCTVRGEGEHVYIVVEDSQWGTNVDQADVDAMLEAWDNSSVGNFPTKGIYELDNENFGPVPDQLDNDPKVYVLWYDFDVNADGFFWAFDMYPDGSQDFASNETEVLYMNSSDFDPGGDYLVAVQAHEFQHMIHWLADENEASWVNEGASELAMWLYGRPDNITAFPSLPDNNLTQWSGNFADYVKTYLFFLYLYEQYGGQATILDLVSQPSNSFTGVDIALDNAGYTENFVDVVADWFVANFIDDPSYGDGRFGYVGDDLPNFAAVTKSSYPVPLTNANVNHWAADYIKMINVTTPQELTFDGGDSSVWAAWLIQRLAGETVSVERIELDAVDSGVGFLPTMGGTYDEAILVAGNISSGGVTTYSYETVDGVAVVPDLTPPGFRFYFKGENPSRSVTRFGIHLDAPEHVDVRIYAADGREVRQLIYDPEMSGRQLWWDGRDDDGNILPSGVYLARARTQSGLEKSVHVVRMK